MEEVQANKLSDVMKETSNFINKFQFPLVGHNPRNTKWELLGTCVLLQLGNDHFLVTAAHVINNRFSVTKKEIYIYNYLNKEKILIDEDIVCNPEDPVPDEHDIAIIKLDRGGYPTIPNDHFLPMHRISWPFNKNEAELLAFSGYPLSRNKYISDPTRNLKGLVYFTNLHNPDISEENPHINSAYDELTILLDFDNSKPSMEGVIPPRPQGMSGGGVWLFSLSGEYNPTLAAISVRYKEKTQPRHIVSVKISYVLAMIKGYFPDTVLKDIDLPIEVLDAEDRARISIMAAP